MSEWKHIALVKADDWKALYVNGECVYQGHSIPDFEWIMTFKNMGIEAVEVWAEEQAEELGGFPASFDEVKQDE